MLGVSETSPGGRISTEGETGSTEAGIGMKGEMDRSRGPIGMRALTCRAQGG